MLCDYIPEIDFYGVTLTLANSCLKGGEIISKMLKTGSAHALVWPLKSEKNILVK